MSVKLILFKPNGQRRDLTLREGSNKIGRGRENDLKIPLDSISRQHCELVVRGSRVTVRDLNSSNGTLVNNDKVREQLLRAGDLLSVGPVTFTVQINGEPANPPPIPAQLGMPDDGEVSDSVKDLWGGRASLMSAPTREDDPIAALEALAADDDDRTDLSRL